MQENNIQDIANTTATTAAQNFLNTASASIREVLSPQFLSDLEEELKAELESLIQSRLLWSQQAIQLALAEQQRRKKAEAARPKPTQAEPPPQLLEPASLPIAKRHIPKSKKIQPQKFTNPLLQLILRSQTKLLSS